MEDLSRINWKLRQLRNWCEDLLQALKENQEGELFEAIYNLASVDIDDMLRDIIQRVDDIREGQDITRYIVTMKQQFNEIMAIFRALYSAYADPPLERQSSPARQPLQQIST